jgi:hypothetical protein
MKRISLLLLLLATGCGTRTWVETTDQWRPLGPSEQRTEDRGIPEQWLNLTGPQEKDGFQIKELVRTDDSGEAEVSLLPAALQVLAYAHDVSLSATRYEDAKEVFATAIDARGAREIVSEWQAQVRLGANPRLRKAEIGLLDRVLNSSGDAQLLEALREIRPAVRVRQEWE